MSSNVYAVSVTTLWEVQGVETSQAYGVLLKDGSRTDWPATLSSISIPNLPLITSITPIAKELYGSGPNPPVTATATLGQLHEGVTPIPWPSTLTGPLATGSTTTKSTSTTSTTSLSSSSTASISSTQTTITSSTSEIPGISTPVATSTRTGTSELPASTSSQAPSVSSPSSGISTGAIAGIAIGCTLAGLSIGLLAAFCLIRRKGKPNSPVDTVVQHHELEAYPTDKLTPIQDIQLSQFLLEATPDRDIAQETQSIGALIDQHVESYYHTHPISIDAETLASALTQLGFPLTTNSVSSLDAQDAAALCLDPGSRRVGLRHVIMRVLFRSIDMHSPHGLSMLPASVTTFLRAIPRTESDRFGDPEANALAIRKWRNLAAFLLHPARSQRTPLPTDDATVVLQAQELASSLNSFLRFFVDRQQQQHQVGHLQAVIEECAKLGYMLFSHPSDWEFVYEVAATRETVGVVVEAGLCKLGGRDGPSDAFPQRLVEPVVVPRQSI